MESASLVAFAEALPLFPFGLAPVDMNAGKAPGFCESKSQPTMLEERAMLGGVSGVGETPSELVVQAPMGIVVARSTRSRA